MNQPQAPILLERAIRALSTGDLNSARRWTHEALRELVAPESKQRELLLPHTMNHLGLVMESFRARSRARGTNRSDVQEDEVLWWTRILGDLEELDHSGSLVEMAFAVQHYVGALLPFLTPLPSYLRFGPEMFLTRARANEASLRFSNIRDLMAPPDSLACLNRANLQGRSVLYACQMDNGPFAEIRAAQGRLMTVSRWRIRPGSQFHGFVIMSNTEECRALYPELFEAYELIRVRNPPRVASLLSRVLSFFVEHFTRQVDKEGSGRYLVSAYAADFLLYQTAHTAGYYQIDAVVYPAVEAGYGMNLAIRPDVFERTCYLERVNEYVVRLPLERGKNRLNGFLLETGRAFACDAAGTIQWDGTRRPA